MKIIPTISDNVIFDEEKPTKRLIFATKNGTNRRKYEKNEFFGYDVMTLLSPFWTSKPSAKLC